MFGFESEAKLQTRVISLFMSAVEVLSFRLMVSTFARVQLNLAIVSVRLFSQLCSTQSITKPSAQPF